MSKFAGVPVLTADEKISKYVSLYVTGDVPYEEHVRSYYGVNDRCTQSARNTFFLFIASI